MSPPSLEERLEILADAAKYDASCASSGTSKRNSRDGKGIGSTAGMGASAARGLLGKTVSVQKERGRPHLLGNCELWITTHPSYLLRLQDDARAAEEQRFAADLARVAARLGELA